MDVDLKLLGRNLAVLAVLYLAGMAAVFGFSVLGVSTLVAFPVFVLGILVASLESDSGFWGALLGLCYLLSYDLLFTAPLYQLKVLNRNDVAALVIFFLVALIMNTVSQRMRRQVFIAQRNELAMGRLNKLSASLIDTTSSEAACQCAQAFLVRVLDRDVRIRLGDPGADAGQAARDCYERNYPTGFGEVGYRGCAKRYLPLGAKGEVCGVVEIDCAESGLDEASSSFLSSVLAQTMIAIERNDLEEEHRAKRIKAEGEKFKTLLLQSVSHDLRTPLTSIAGNADVLLKDARIAPETRRELLGAIHDDALWLNDMVENLLSMSRVQDEDIALEKTPEIVDEVIGTAVGKMERRRGGHRLRVELPEDILLVPMDGGLVSRVLINLIDNAIRHSSPTSTIDVSARKDGPQVLFSVADDGGGLGPGDPACVFSRFYAGDRADGGRKGMGLGLSICKAIVEAHGGTIRAFNNEQGGATFEFALPLEGGCDDEDG